MPGAPSIMPPSTIGRHAVERDGLGPAVGVGVGDRDGEGEIGQRVGARIDGKLAGAGGRSELEHAAHLVEPGQQPRVEGGLVDPQPAAALEADADIAQRAQRPAVPARARRRRPWRPGSWASARKVRSPNSTASSPTCAAGAHAPTGAPRSRAARCRRRRTPTSRSLAAASDGSISTVSSAAGLGPIEVDGDARQHVVDPVARALDRHAVDRDQRGLRRLQRRWRPVRAVTRRRRHRRARSRGRSRWRSAPGADRSPRPTGRWPRRRSARETALIAARRSSADMAPSTAIAALTPPARPISSVPGEGGTAVPGVSQRLADGTERLGRELVRGGQAVDLEREAARPRRRFATLTPTSSAGRHRAAAGEEGLLGLEHVLVGAQQARRVAQARDAVLEVLQQRLQLAQRRDRGPRCARSAAPAARPAGAWPRRRRRRWPRCRASSSCR